MKKDHLHTSMDISKLLVGYRRGRLTAEEQRRLEEWIMRDDANRALFEEMTGAMDEEVAQYRHAFEGVDSEEALARLKARIRETAGTDTATIPTLRAPHRRLWLQVAAAALMLVSLGVAFYLARYESLHSAMETAWQDSDITPGGNRAILKLSDGQTLTLSEEKDGIVVAANGLIYSDGTALVEIDGESVTGHQHPSKGHHLATYELSTPRGGYYQISLSDGTRVWLNASSSLRYPASFEAKEPRIVELIGEAYFEVSHEPSRPFLVKSPTQQVEVLGTKFNLSAYSDDEFVRTTLLEGAVRVYDSARKHAVALLPGQQSTQQSGMDGLEVQFADTEEAIAWKEGYFKFNDESLESIMKKISRWYNVDVVYQGSVRPDQVFSGRISRSDNFKSVLETLELTGGVRFKIEERRVVVME